MYRWEFPPRSRASKNAPRSAALRLVEISHPHATILRAMFWPLVKPQRDSATPPCRCSVGDATTPPRAHAICSAAVLFILLAPSFARGASKGRRFHHRPADELCKHPFRPPCLPCRVSQGSAHVGIFAGTRPAKLAPKPPNLLRCV